MYVYVLVSVSVPVGEPERCSSWETSSLSPTYFISVTFAAATPARSSVCSTGRSKTPSSHVDFFLVSIPPLVALGPNSRWLSNRSPVSNADTDSTAALGCVPSAGEHMSRLPALVVTQSMLPASS